MRGEQAIWLVGMMGAGKSTVGAALARQLGRRFVDTDCEIERAAGRSIPEIFAEAGEDAFRGLERQAVEEAAHSDAVIALGGGAMAQPAIRERLSGAGTVVYLKADPAKLLERIGDARERPLLEGLDENARLERVRALLVEREPGYACADWVVDTGDADSEAVASEIAARLRTEGGESRVHRGVA